MVTAMNVIKSGAAIKTARAAVILLHGRGGLAEDILALGEDFDERDVAYLAPQAAGGSWYPQSFLAPVASNEPYLARSLTMLGELISTLNAQGMPLRQIALVGFSQGACLALEYAARNAERFAGIAALSGGLIGPEGTSRDYRGTLDGTPVFIGCSDVDYHIPLHRVKESTSVLRHLGARVDERIYPGMGHTINDDEVRAVKGMLSSVANAQKLTS